MSSYISPNLTLYVFIFLFHATNLWICSFNSRFTGFLCFSVVFGIICVNHAVFDSVCLCLRCCGLKYYAKSTFISFAYIHAYMYVCVYLHLYVYDELFVFCCFSFYPFAICDILFRSGVDR